MLLLALGACNDYGFSPDEKEDGTDSETGFTADSEDDGTTLDVCPDLETLADGAAIDESCVTEPVSGELLTQVEWSISDFGDASYAQVLTAPVVGQLDDDDGDGDIDEDDIPDIVVVADDDGAEDSEYGLLAVVRGSDGNVTTTLFESTDGTNTLHPYRYATPALADLDADGTPEIITVARFDAAGGGDTSTETGGVEETDVDVIVIVPPPSDDGLCKLAAWYADGSFAWVSDEPIDCVGDMVSVADLDGDGSGEVLAGNSVFSADGSRLWMGGAEARYPAYAEVGMQPIAMDLDADGDLEVLFGKVVHEHDGSQRCRLGDEVDDGFPAVADLDGEGLGEFILVGNGKVSVWQDDCVPGASWTLAGSGNGGPPTIADFDGDTRPEIGIADAEFYTVYESDGTVLWSVAITDASSHATGSSVFDFDSDGQAEVLYGDETTLWVFDGATGAVRLADTSHSSRTLHELPVAADVDNDGEMEIVVPQGGGHYDSQFTGLYVLGSAGSPWFGDRQVWNQHAYSITNINDDLTLPVPAEPNWPFYNTFRSGALGASAGGSLPDAIGWAQACTDPCDEGEIGLEVRLANGGLASLQTDVAITVYAVDGATERPLQTLRSATALDSGEGSATWWLRYPAADVPEGVLVVRVDDDEGRQAVLECHEDNNEVRLEGLVCP